MIGKFSTSKYIYTHIYDELRTKMVYFLNLLCVYTYTYICSSLTNFKISLLFKISSAIIIIMALNFFSPEICFLNFFFYSSNIAKKKNILNPRNYTNVFSVWTTAGCADCRN